MSLPLPTRIWISFAAQAPSLTLVVAGALEISAAIWVVPQYSSLSTVLVILGAGQLTLGVVVARAQSFSIGPGGLKAVLKATQRRALEQGFDRDDTRTAIALAVSNAWTQPAELGAVRAEEIALEAVEQVAYREPEEPTGEPELEPEKPQQPSLGPEKPQQPSLGPEKPQRPSPPRGPGAPGK